MKTIDPVLTAPESANAYRVLWRMKGQRRVISAVLRRQPIGVYELVVGFEDNPREIIESQVEPTGIGALLQRADALRQVLVEKGLTALPVF
jgi:hypothetical protein